MPRESNLTTEVFDSVVAYVRNGSTFKDACALSGVPEGTGREWLSRGRETSDRPMTAIFAAFADAVKKAEIEAKQEAIAIVREAATGFALNRQKITSDDRGGIKEEISVETVRSWQAAAWYLERKYSHEWGTKRMDVLEALRTLHEAGWIPQELVEVAANGMGDTRARIQEAFSSAINGSQ
jgi:transposase